MTPYRLEISLGRDKVEKQLGRRRPIVCWNCEKQGHVARACRSFPPEFEQQGNFSPSGVKATPARKNL